MARSITLGIVAHVDAGKTSLTERLLFQAGVLDRPGRVDDGDTRTDTLALERQRGITIRAAVVSFRLGDLPVNLVDTPGHPDFIAEVERSLAVLDAAILVVSAVEGVQPQTRILWRTLRRLGIPTLLFVNKVDRAGAAQAPVLAAIRRRLSRDVPVLTSVRGMGTPAAGVQRRDSEQWRTELLDILTRHDDALLADVVEGRPPSPARLDAVLAAQSRRGLVHPVLFGSAITGAGVDLLADAVPVLLPAWDGDETGVRAGRVFAVQRGDGGERVALLRLTRGTLTVRDRLQVQGPHAVQGSRERVTGLAVFDAGAVMPRARVLAGELAQVRGLHRVRVGDVLDDDQVRARDDEALFPPPALDAAVVPHRPADRPRLRAALAELAEQDPLIDLRLDPDAEELRVSLYGEVQKEVLAATLALEHGLEVEFGETSTVHVERVIGVGTALAVMKTPENPFLATVGLRVEPRPPGSGTRFCYEIELGSLPPAFLRAIEDTVRASLRQGRYGWPVLDCEVTLTRSGYCPRQSHAHQRFAKSMSSTGGDFRLTTPMVVAAALARAGTRVCEPVDRFLLELPASAYPAVAVALREVAAVITSTVDHAGDLRIEGDLPAGQVARLRRRLPDLTGGDGVLETSFDRYVPVSGPPPIRARRGPDPSDRRRYLLAVRSVAVERSQLR